MQGREGFFARGGPGPGRQGKGFKGRTKELSGHFFILLELVNTL